MCHVFGCAQAEEAIARAEGDPHAPFVAEEMAALGLVPRHTQAVLRQGDAGLRVERAGVAPGVWSVAGVELAAADGASQLAALSMARVEGLALALE